MDRISVLYTRSALIWLISGFLLGGLMLSDRVIPGDWRAWFAPTHGHILFVGWFLQFAIGVGYWLLPRKRSSERPVGYDERAATFGFGLLNAGLVLRVAAEPVTRAGDPSVWTDIVLGGSSIAQVAAVTIIAGQIWRRIVARSARSREQEP